MLSLDCALRRRQFRPLSDLIASDAPSPAREATTCEFSELVAACMERLGESQREILVLRNGLNQSYGDIALALGISIGTVKSRIGRARENLRLLLTSRILSWHPDARPLGWFEPPRSAGASACLRLRAFERNCGAGNGPVQMIVTWTLLSMMPCAIA
jgi:RNA polymerase sigma-70 factor, ECF subfamily